MGLIFGPRFGDEQAAAIFPGHEKVCRKDSCIILVAFAGKTVSAFFGRLRSYEGQRYGSLSPQVQELFTRAT